MSTHVSFLRISILIFLLSCMQTLSAQRMRANLLIVDANGTTLMDGNMTDYNALFSNAIDGYDVRKMSNFGENFGILRFGTTLVVERRNLVNIADTTYFRMWNMKVRNYRLQVTVENMHNYNLVAVVHDKYLGTNTPVNLNDTTDVNFSVITTPGSYAQDRFKLIFTSISSGTLPVQFTGVQLQSTINGLQVLWSVENEFALDRYVIEHSANGSNFETLKESDANNNGLKNNYTVLTNKPFGDIHYVRVKAISLSGKIQYSDVVRLITNATSREILSIYPNPIANKQLNMMVDIAEAGTFKVSLVAVNGRSIPLNAVTLTKGLNLQSISLPKATKQGIYRLKLAGPGGKLLLQTVSIQ